VTVTRARPISTGRAKGQGPPHTIDWGRHGGIPIRVAARRGRQRTTHPGPQGRRRRLTHCCPVLFARSRRSHLLKMMRIVALLNMAAVATAQANSRLQDCPLVAPGVQYSEEDQNACETTTGCLYMEGGGPWCEGQGCDGSQDQTSCEAEGCTFHGGGDAACTRPECATWDSEQTSCEDAGCHYTAPVNSFCEGGGCDPSLDQATCEGDGCTFFVATEPVCREPECADFSHDAATCGAMGCMYRTGTIDMCEGESTTGDACEEYSYDSALCHEVGCMFTPGDPGGCAQRPQCGAFTDEWNCAEPGGCVWDTYGQGSCRNDCLTFGDHTSCSGADGCNWEDHSHCAFSPIEPARPNAPTPPPSAHSSDCNDEAVQRLLQLEEEPGICALIDADVSCPSFVESLFATGVEMPPGSELLVTGCSREACEAAGFGWFDDGSQAGACTYLAHVDALRSVPPEHSTWQEVRTICLGSDPAMMWITETELSLRAQLKDSARRDWASDAQQMQKDRVQVFEQLRKEKAELEKTVETLSGLLQKTKGRRCFGPQ
jgi:hypothetical protein